MFICVTNPFPASAEGLGGEKFTNNLIITLYLTFNFFCVRIREIEYEVRIK